MLHTLACNITHCAQLGCVPCASNACDSCLPALVGAHVPILLLCAVQGVGTLVKERMIYSHNHPEAELRPMLLFPEGTTTNGKMLLPFKTGGFLAGVPVRPCILQYHTVGTLLDCCFRIYGPMGQ